MTRKDFQKFIKACQNDLDKNFILEYKDTDKDYYLNFVKVMRKDTIFEEEGKPYIKGEKGIFVDIFPFENANKNDSIFLGAQAKVSNLIRNIMYSRVGLKGDSKVKEMIKKMFGIFSNTSLLNFQEKVMTLNKNDNSKYISVLSGAYSYKKDTYLREKFFPLTELEFEGKKYAVPKDYDYYMSKLYGDYMTLPPIEKRRTHNPKRLEFYK
jgi:lipopolysaccharide cholinephosphotransferase